MKWFDTTLPMQTNTVHWPGHPRYTVTTMMSMENGEGMNVTSVEMCSHFGTHIDAPRHYYTDGNSVDNLSLDVLMGPCKVVAYEDKEHIPEKFINELDLNGVTRLLIRTENSKKLTRPEFYEDYIGLSIEAAQALVERGVKLLGVDGYSIGPFDPAIGMPVHRIFLGAGPDQIAIEEVNLSEIEAGEYHLIALPLPLTGLEAAPARVLLGR